MRTLHADTLTALSQSAYHVETRATLKPTQMFWYTPTANFPWVSAEATGIIATPTPQDISVCPAGLFTVANINGTLEYALQGSATLTSLGLPAIGKPGLFSNHLFFLDNSYNLQHYTLDWTTIQAGTGTFWSASANWGQPTWTDASVSVHAISATACALFQMEQGGIRPSLFINGTESIAPVRFMFPHFFNYITTDPELLAKGAPYATSAHADATLTQRSGAAQLGTRFFLYVSNFQTGMVQGIYYDTSLGTWSDIFTAVPTDLPAGLCEFQIANAYTVNTTLYLSGQFHRTENIRGDQTYNLILSSTDGINFNIGRETLVSTLGYRFQAVVDNHILYLGSCNRVCSASATYPFDSGSTESLSIPAASILSFEDNNNESAGLTLAAADEVLIDHAYLQVGSQITIEVGYDTVSGTRWNTHGTYLIDSIPTTIGEASRDLKIQLIDESIWRLSGLYSPFYAEIFSKSSIYDPLEEDSGNLTPAVGTSRGRTVLSIDFWQHEPWTYTGNGENITGISMADGGGVNYYVADTYPHAYGLITKELATILDIEENPLIEATSIPISIYGWSRSNVVGTSMNDHIRLAFITTDEAGTETVHLTPDSLSLRFPNEWPTHINGYFPIDLFMSGLTIGHRLKKIAIVFVCPNPSCFNIARVDLGSLARSIRVQESYDDPNTPWTATEADGWELPGYGRPYIMFSQKPYNAFNFRASGHFLNTITNGMAAYPVACGLVGLGDDGNNCIVARYNRSGDLFELVKVRNGIETNLQSVGAGGPHGDIHLCFTHRDGQFTLDYRTTGTAWIATGIQYEWQLADGYLYTSLTSSMKTGIYGLAYAPQFRICGFRLGADENGQNADGIPALPNESLSGWPASGEVQIDNSTYYYGSVVNLPVWPVYARGPYQFRANGSEGSSSYLDYRDYDPTLAADTFNDKLVAIDDGACYVVSAIDPTVQTSTGGVVTELRNRMRVYSTNTMIGSAPHSLANRVWITGGLGGITGHENASATHPTGSICQLKLSGKIVCKQFSGASGNTDATIQDLIDILSRNAGAVANFPGAITTAALSLNGSSTLATLEYTEGLDLRFKSATPAAFNLQLPMIDGRYPSDTGILINLVVGTPGNYSLNFTSTPSYTVIEQVPFSAGTAAHEYRFLAHNNFISFYLDGKWVHTFSAPSLTYAITFPVIIAGTLDLTDIRIQELADWREAIYIDMETDLRSAISSVIQERPVEMVCKSDGSVDYYYKKTRSTITPTIRALNHQWVRSIPRDCASDAIVYQADKVSCYQYAPFAQTFGFATKVMRFPNLWTGAVKATAILLERLFQNRIHHSLSTRVDERIEKGDIYTIAYTTPGTARTENHTIIVENVQTTIRTNSWGMSLEGRQAS